MRKTISLLTVALAALSSAPTSAIQVKEGALSNKRLFGIEFPENLQSFYGRHDRINSVSLQEYQAGPFTVTEVTIDMAQSPLQLRIYHTKPTSTEQATQMVGEANPAGRTPSVPAPVQNLIDRGQNQANQSKPPVVKDYPLTTHAKTLEFRVSSQTELQQFYRAFVGAYTQNNATGASDESDDDSETRELAGTLFLIE